MADGFIIKRGNLGGTEQKESVFINGICFVAMPAIDNARVGGTAL
jgi:hypothetical protein